MDAISPEPLLTHIAKSIQLSIAPVFLLSAIGTTLLVLTNRLGRIVDRTRILEERIVSVPKGDGDSFRSELMTLSRRARLINLAITLGTVCALLICVMIAFMFAGGFLSLDLSLIVSLLFVGAMLAFIGTLLFFLREILVAVKAMRQRRL